MTNKIGTRFLPVALLAAAALMPASAFGSIFGEVEGDGFGAASNSYGNGPQSCSYGYSSVILSGSCMFTNNGSITVPQYYGQGNTFTADFYSSVDPSGGLHAYASAGFTNYPGSTLAEVDAEAFSADTLTFVPPGPAIPFQVVLKVSLDGVIKSFVPEDVAGYAELNYNGNHGPTYYDQTSGGEVLTMPAVTVSSGATYTYTLELTAYAEIGCDTNQPVLVLCSSTVTADFSDTAQISQIVLEDMSGNQLSGYTVNSQSGVNYNSLLAGDPSGAPEPGTWALTACALVAGLAKWRKRKSQIG